MARVTQRDIDTKLERVEYTLRKTNYTIIFGGDIAGTAVYLKSKTANHSGVERTLLYGATKAEVSLYLDGFLDLIGYSQARVLKTIS